MAALERHPYRLFGSFRLLLAVLVLVSHGGGGLSDIVGYLGLGNVGVFLFFVVSGFVICEALDIFYRDSIMKFIGNRCLKIFPAYWAATIIAYVAYASVDASRFPSDAAVQLPIRLADQLATNLWVLLVNATMVLGYLKQGNGLTILSLTWAVLVEIMFYLMAAVTFLVVSKSKFPGMTLGIAAIGALGFYLFVWWTESQTRFFGFFQFAPYFVFGSALYFFTKKRDAWKILLIGTSFLLSVHAYYIYATNLPTAGDSWLSDYGLQWNVVFSTGLFVAGATLFAQLIPVRTRPSGEWVDKRLGDITYAVYLVHMPFIMVAAYLAIGGISGFSFIVIATFITAFLIHRFVERPFMGLRDRFRGQRLYA